MSSIPEDIRQEILLRLPVESIARFKCVCKRWHTYITSPKFINDHLIRASKNPRILIRDKLLPSGRHKFHIVDYDSISSSSSALSSYKSKTVVRLNYPVLIKNGFEICYSHVMGSCNGLLFLIARKCPMEPILWNPSTGEYKEIIPPVDNFGWSSPGFYPAFYRWWPSTGFCYDGVIDDYKLVCIASYRVYVYTLRSGSWRKLVKAVPCTYGKRMGLVLNGSLHWLLATPTGEISNAILAFDISSEKVMNLFFPEEIIPGKTRCGYNNCDLRLLGDSLCIVCGVRLSLLDRRVDVWVMHNYGVTESWTKLFTTTQETITKHPRHELKFYWYFRNGDILMQVSGRFGLYDQTNNRIKFIDINGFNVGAFLVGEGYVGSLVSLNSGTYLTKCQMGTKYTSQRREGVTFHFFDQRTWREQCWHRISTTKSQGCNSTELGTDSL